MSVRRLADDGIQPAAFAFSSENQAWAEKVIARYPAGRQQSAVIPILFRAQEQEGWVTRASIEAVAKMLDMPLAFNSLRALRAALYAEFPHLAQIDQIVPGGIDGTRDLAGRATKTETAKLTSPIGDFYMTNPIARASAIMRTSSWTRADEVHGRRNGSPSRGSSRRRSTSLP